MTFNLIVKFNSIIIIDTIWHNQANTIQEKYLKQTTIHQIPIFSQTITLHFNSYLNRWQKILNKNTVGSSLISFFYFDTSLRISISRLGSNQAAGRFLNTFISLSDLIQCLVEQLYNEPAADAYSCYLSFLLYVYPSPLALLYYSNVIFQAYCANCGPCPDIAFFRIFSSSEMVHGS